MKYRVGERYYAARLIVGVIISVSRVQLSLSIEKDKAESKVEYVYTRSPYLTCLGGYL